MVEQVAKKPVSDVLAAIVDDVFTDKQIDQILMAINFRKLQKAKKINKGDVVKITHQSIRPRYLLGVVCVVTGKGPVNLSVRPKDPIGHKWDCGFRIKPEWVSPVQES